jgi:transcriptional regulator with XRE-family HTH domain
MSKIADLRKTVGFRLKDLRKSLAFNQEKMAAFFGLKRTSYSKYETGEVSPNYLVLEKLGNSFDASLDWLVCGKGPMFFKEKTTGENTNIQEEEGLDQGEKEVPPVLQPPQVLRQAPAESPFGREHRELVEHMEKIPLLHYEVMAFYHRFKIDNKELVEAALSLDTSSSI